MDVNRDIENKHDYPRRADALAQMAQQEYNHAMTWHEFAVADIDQAKKDHPDMSDDLAAVMADKWAEEHEHFMDKAATFKKLLEVYKETR